MGQIARPHNDRSAGMDWVVRVQVGTGEVWRFPATTGFQLDSYTIDMLPDLSTPYEHRLSWNRMTISERCFARDPPERPAILEIMVPIKPIGSSSTAYIFRHQDLPPEVISARIKSNRHELPVSEWQPSSMLSVPIETECAIDILFRDGTTTTLSIKVTRASDD
ncbi:Uncharacterized protein PBTT_10181 [Plasmodiophora brassicae]|uniref:Uncharacterized protein n=1 Tax=Plasmodiophora brassicae TaxID=37360 RepID=A0A0G4INP1_PLABS|nr:hypothetical protein PBRA_005460 [Plasmodiophora brassicae]